MRWISPRRQMTYAQWLENCRKQAAASQAEAELPVETCECEEPEAEMLAAGAGSIRAQVVQSASTVVSEITAIAASAEISEKNDVKQDPTWLPTVEYFQAGRPFHIGEIAVSPFTIPHDAADPVGFVFQAEGVRMAVATDLGYVPPNVKAQLKGVDLLLLESNHDLEMLRDGPYPWSVKQRVLSRVGHLSNDATARFLESGYDGQARFVILGHLSESNNLPELARVTAERALSCHGQLLMNRLLLAAQHEPLSAIQF
jgi:phosphoribosyl 1,2-cyclic phosphodiesterase